MIYVYRTLPSNGARDLVVALDELGFQARRLRHARRDLRPEDLVVCWGQQWEWPLTGHGPVVRNSRGPIGKIEELRAYVSESVPTVRWTAASARPEGWLARTRQHQEGRDLSADLSRGDYYVMREEDVVREFRIHVLHERSIRAAVKVAGEGAHSWIRSHRLGWRLDYGQECQRQLSSIVRETAKAAVRALGYDFGAVDIGLRTDGSPVVFETNSAPGLENHNTALAYARHLGAIWQEGLLTS